MFLLLTIIALGFISESSVYTNAMEIESFSRIKRLINGKDSKIEEFPYLVALEYWSRKSVCSGVIISSNHIITAAHCFYFTKDPSSFIIRAGSSYRLKGGTLYKVKSIKIHHEYDGKRYYNDLALLTLRSPIVFDSKKQPIPMFGYGEEIKSGSIGSVAGWGFINSQEQFPEQLQSIQLKIVGKADCRFLWKGNAGTLNGKICATSYYGRDKGTCQGDSGGALVIGGRLAGIVSSGKGDCTNWPKPEFYTEIAYFREWIDSNTSQRNSNAEKKDSVELLSLLLRLLIESIF